MGVTESGEQVVYCPILGLGIVPIGMVKRPRDLWKCKKEECAWYVSEKGCAIKVLAEKDPLYHISLDAPTEAV